ncbi:PorP/SprF family type IX secretion system membrane protein [Winogradskyella sp. SYSU M77433]|uniref:PorP/SprF family type IX secretion system membrane protein n=1 Tax=Winogradskyella sp. SYSU M77433 TaxID=3042722 RepID=UPI0024806855|nr:PorP/SprF family type IX secretion system membrane protein [Winogradskyella sp. SYSU M77433]MDH7912341.1 PorP/SprF family type IX secretion system membrane protein [Winogradskyella sp. SYSU M77433]
MKEYLLVILLCICFSQLLQAQEDDGVVAFNLPTRNSLTFNRFAINPTFSFVREQTKYITVYNKREWVQFEDAPLTYLAAYSGRFSENIGAGASVFQQNYGVLTTFGGVLNFAYNARLGRDNNLTFGLNVGAYSSGVNTSNVVTNFADPALENVPSNFLLTINPGINFGTEFLDFGVSVSNLALYNLNTSELIQDNPQQGLQAHMLYTGYMDSRGFFDESKFSGMIKSEFQKDETIISGIAMLTVPKGIWGQVGYNTLYGVSGGLGLNITEQIAIEYNYETPIGGDLGEFGPSHEITLAYRFKNDNYYNYGNDDEVTGIFSNGNKKRRRRVVKSSNTKSRNTNLLGGTSKPKAEEDAEAKKLAEQKVKEEAEAKRIAEQKAKEEADKQAKLLAEQKAKEEAEAKKLAEQQAKEEEEKAKAIAETRAKILAEQKAKEEADEKARLLAEQKAKEEAEEQAKLLAEQKAKEEAEEQARLLAEQKAKEEAEEQARLLAEQKAKEEAEEQARLLAEQKAKEEAEEQARLLAEQKAKEEAEEQAKLLAEQKAKEEAEKLTNEELVTKPTDDLGKSMQAIAKSTEASKEQQNDLMDRYNDIINIKDEDLKALKEENDLSDQGIKVQPRPFKSVTAENNELNAIKSELDKIIEERNKEIKDLEELYDERIANTELDEVNLFYKKKIDRLKDEQLKAIKTRSQLETKLEEIRVATEFEKRRRIKRAAFDNEEDRYAQDRAALERIKRTTETKETPYTAEDFDYGEELGNNIKILKNIKNVESGYYLIIAVHSNPQKRNEFVTKVVESGRSDVDFFHDVATSKYYIYYEKYDSIQSANNALKSKGNRPYNGKMSIVKIEN